jgi:serine/threonine protein kinase
LNLTEKNTLFLNIAKVLKEIHFSGYYHGDIKQSNILINDDINDIKIIDFSLSENRLNDNYVKNTFPFCTPFDLVNQGIYKSDRKLKAIADCFKKYNMCLHDYLMMEDVDNVEEMYLKEDGAKGDIWCFGILIFNVLVGHHFLLQNENSVPLDHESIIDKKKYNRENLFHIYNEFVIFLSDIETYIDNYNFIDCSSTLIFKYKCLLKLMLRFDYKNRIDIEDVINILNSF